MSIIINNISEKKGIPYGSGKQYYELKINSEFMVEFTHDFEDGLSECLRRAADAFETQERINSYKMIDLVLKMAETHD